MAVYLVHRPFQVPYWPRSICGHLLFLLTRAPPALYIPAPAPVSYVQRSSDFRLARENMVSYLLHSWEGYLMP